MRLHKMYRELHFPRKVMLALIMYCTNVRTCNKKPNHIYYMFVHERLTGRHVCTYCECMWFSNHCGCLCIYTIMCILVQLIQCKIYMYITVYCFLKAVSSFTIPLPSPYASVLYTYFPVRVFYVYPVVVCTQTVVWHISLCLYMYMSKWIQVRSV